MLHSFATNQIKNSHQQQRLFFVVVDWTILSFFVFLFLSFQTTTTTTTHAFVVPATRTITRTTTTTTTTTTRLNVFERLSEECVQAIMKGQQYANQYQSECVNDIHVVVGCLEQSSESKSSALKRTLTQYQITLRNVSQQLEQELGASSSSSNNNNAGWLAGFRAASNQQDRPFGNDMKATLKRASTLADQMSNPIIETHHVFLSLLGYQEETSSSSSSSKKQANEDSAAWKLLQESCSIHAITALQVCESLLGHLQTTTTIDGKELVTGVGGSATATPTLSQVAVDLTQQAQDGLLDPVYGRDREIRACLRTLLRRRKNNVCLVRVCDVFVYGVYNMEWCE